MPSRTEQRPQEKPQLGQRTGAQQGDDVASFLGGLQGFSEVEAGTFKTYRKMREHPTIALARAVAGAPIRAADWSFEATDGAPAGAREQIEAWMIDYKDWLIHNCLFAFDYGYQAFEVVVAEQDGAYVFRKLKPLLPDATTILVDKKTGSFQGLKQKEVTLNPANCFVYTYDMEAGNYYGRSRNENCRQWWKADLDLLTRQGQYVTKVAGIIPMVHYPPGKGADAGGTERSNYDNAKKLLERLGTGHGVAVPNRLVSWAQDLVSRGIDPSKVRAWTIDILEAGTAHGSDFVEQHRHFESQLMRGWLVPERAATEGQAGTKAEAEAHADIAMVVAEWSLAEMIRHINWYLVDRLLLWNYGPQAMGTVRIVPSPIVDEQVALLRSLLKSVFTAQTIDLFAQIVDVESVLKQLGLPLLEDGAREPATKGIDVPAGNNGDGNGRVSAEA